VWARSGLALRGDFMASDLFNVSLNATAGSITNKCRRRPLLACSNPFSLTCVEHGETIAVRCKRWRTCPGCARWKEWSLKQRFLAGIEAESPGKLPMFFTLTFPQAVAPDEDGAHASWRKLVGRLDYRQMLGPYGWVLQRQQNATLHYHGVAFLPFQTDGLALWRELLTKSGFGIQNKLVIADAHHAGYIARYIARRKGLADLAHLRRAYGFSADFPQARALTDRVILAEDYGVVPDSDCTWVPSYELRF
jgi:hypothetical protein